MTTVMTLNSPDPMAKLRIMTALLMVTLTTNACSPGAIGQAERAVNAGAIDVNRMVYQSRNPTDANSTGRVSVSSAAYIPAVARRSTHGRPLPAHAARISIAETTAQTLPEIARTLTKRGGIPVTLSPDINPSGTTTTASPAAMPGGLLAPGGVQAAIGRLEVADRASDLSNIQGDRILPPTESAMTMTLRWDGPYTGLLDTINAKFGTTYTYDGSTILISRNITRTFTIHALASKLEMSQSLVGNGMNGGGGGGPGGGNGAIQKTTQDIRATNVIKIWEDVVAGVESIVTKNGTVAALVSTGTITVTAPPPVIEAVQRYVDQQNRSLENEITVTIQVLSVQLTNSDNNSFDLQALINSNGAKISLGNQSAPSSVANTGQITPGVSIVSGGTTATLQAISQLGRVLTRTQNAVTTMNGHVAPLQLTNTRSYVAQQTVTNTGSSTGGVQTAVSLQPGTVTTGFNFAVLPRVDFKDRTVLLQYGISISALAGAVNGFDVFTTPNGQATIQLANVNQMAFINSAEIPDGETLVITGFEQDQNTANMTGFGNPGFWGLSGSQYGNHARTMTVIMITPTVQRIRHRSVAASPT